MNRLLFSFALLLVSAVPCAAQPLGLEKTPVEPISVTQELPKGARILDLTLIIQMDKERVARATRQLQQSKSPAEMREGLREMEEALNVLKARLAAWERRAPSTPKTKQPELEDPQVFEDPFNAVFKTPPSVKPGMTRDQALAGLKKDGYLVEEISNRRAHVWRVRKILTGGIEWPIWVTFKEDVVVDAGSTFISD